MKKTREKRGFELAPLPRERVGPFLLLGVAKDADSDAIEAHWAQCVLWARQGKTQVPLGDIHWARDLLRDADSRLAADAASLNTDIASQELRRLARLFHLESKTPAWSPHDPAPPLPAAGDIPSLDAVRATIPAPDVQIELPGVARWLEAFAASPIDPWVIPAKVTRPTPEPTDD